MQYLAQVFKGLSEETRLEIWALLTWSRELCVCDIENILGETQSKISRHLKYLLNLGIIKSRREIKWIYYSINRSDEKISKVVELLNTLYENERYLGLKENLRKRLASKSKNCC